jgi:hypothetical protein
MKRPVLCIVDHGLCYHNSFMSEVIDKWLD